MIDIPSNANPVGVADIENSLTDVESVNSDQTAAIDNLTTEVSTLNTSVSNITTSLDNTVLKVSDLEEAQTLTQQQLSDNTASLSSVSDDLDTLKDTGANLNPSELDLIQLTVATRTYDSVKSTALTNSKVVNGSGELTSMIKAGDYFLPTANAKNELTLLKHDRCVDGINVECPTTVFKAIPELDGMDRIDTGGRYATLSEAITDTDSNIGNSVLSCKDFIGEEFWFERVTDLDVVFINGDVHDTGLSIGNVNPSYIKTMTELNIPVGYTAIHSRHIPESESVGLRWSTLPNVDKIAFVSNENNRVYLYQGEWIQLRRRIVMYRLPTNTIVTAPNGIHCENHSHKVPVRGSAVAVKGITDLEVAGSYFTTEDTSDDVAFNALSLYTPNNIDSDSSIFDRCFLMPLALIQKRNKGIYVTGLNDYGTAPTPSLLNSENEISLWYESEVKGISDGTSDGLLYPSDLAGCFNKDNWVSSNFGMFEEGLANNYSPLNAVADAIYASDIRMMCNSCLPISDHRVLLDNLVQSFILGESGHTLRVPYTRVDDSIPAFYYSATIIDLYLEFRVDNLLGDYIDFTSYGFTQGNGVMVWQPETGYKAYGTVDTGTGRLKLHNTLNELGTGKPGGFNNGLNQTSPCYIAYVKLDNYESAEPIWCDVIGSYQAVSTIYPNGFYGTWLGEYEHDKKVSDVPLTRKASENKAVLALSSSAITGATENVDLWELANIEQNSNTLSGNYPASGDLVTTLFYRTKAIETKLTEHGKIVSYTGVKVLSESEANKGNALQEAITGNFNTGGGILGGNLPIISSTINTDSKFSNVSGSEPVHHPVGYSHGDPLVLRLLPYLTINEETSKYRLVFGFNELRRNPNAYDGAPITVIPLGINESIYKGELYKLPDNMENPQFAGVVLLAITDGAVTMTTDKYNNASFISTSNDIKDLSTGQYDAIFNRFNGSTWASDQFINIDDYMNSEKDLAGRDCLYGCSSIDLNILARS